MDVVERVLFAPCHNTRAWKSRSANLDSQGRSNHVVHDGSTREKITEEPPRNSSTGVAGASFGVPRLI